MPRTTSEAVITILRDGGNYTDKSDVASYIEIANSIVTNVCTDAAYTDTLLELIERWLSAWAYLLMNPVKKFKSAGKVQASMESKIDLGFNLNKYGQAAMRVDYLGSLARLDNSQKVIKNAITGSVTWLGTELT